MAHVMDRIKGHITGRNRAHNGAHNGVAGMADWTVAILLASADIVTKHYKLKPGYRLTYITK